MRRTDRSVWKLLLMGSVLSAVTVVYAQDKAKKSGAKGQQTTAVQRGEYLTTVAGCNDCHTPMKMGDKGPEPDMTRKLSGHPESLKMPPAPAVKEPWMMVGSATATAWAGPWGISYTANLTPDKETGIGNWTEQTFITTLRTGKHEGRGRQILPPMPWQMIGQMTDDDLKAIFAYLQTLPPIKNRVPQPVPPQGMGGSGSGGEGAPKR